MKSETKWKVEVESYGNETPPFSCRQGHHHWHEYRMLGQLKRSCPKCGQLQVAEEIAANAD